MPKIDEGSDSPGLGSAADYHEKFKMIQFTAYLATKSRLLSENVDGIQHALAHNPNKSMGTLMVHFNSNQPATVYDFSAGVRPTDGDKVKILDYEFTLMEAQDSKATEP